MQLKATIANVLWTTSNLPAYWRFCRALKAPHIFQNQKLHHLLKQNANTAFGKAHGFDRIRSYVEFTRRVPLSDYSALEPWIARIRQGETNVLTREGVTRLIPTSGSTGARKLIPFTLGLQRELNAAIGPWLVDLTRRCPGLIGGPAYWSITPVMVPETGEASAVPIGFDTDTAYLGGCRRRLADAAVAVPPGVSQSSSLESFRYQTLLHLVRCRELRLISVWHPSFLSLLLDALPELWEQLLTDVECGIGACPPLPRRAAELGVMGPHDLQSLWPNLRVISCWGEHMAALNLQKLSRCFPGVWFQPKGLIATEAFVTLPFQGQYALAVSSHFFEFIDSNGRVHPAEAIQDGQEYEVVVTTAGGLWRYRLGDRVRVEGRVDQSPSLRFLGRGDNVSDHFGEKLTESFVTQCFRKVFDHESPCFALLAPDEDDAGHHYTLYVKGAANPHWAGKLEQELRRNPHYAYCRELRQLLPLRVFTIAEQAFEVFAARHTANGARLGDAKPTVLSRHSGWSKVFVGTYEASGAEVAAGRSNNSKNRTVVDVHR